MCIRDIHGDAPVAQGIQLRQSRLGDRPAGTFVAGTAGRPGGRNVDGLGPGLGLALRVGLALGPSAHTTAAAAGSDASRVAPGGP